MKEIYEGALTPAMCIILVIEPGGTPGRPKTKSVFSNGWNLAGGVTNPRLRLWSFGRFRGWLVISGSHCWVLNGLLKCSRCCGKAHVAQACPRCNIGAGPDLRPDGSARLRSSATPPSNKARQVRSKPFPRPRTDELYPYHQTENVFVQRLG